LDYLLIPGKPFNGNQAYAEEYRYFLHNVSILHPNSQGSQAGMEARFLIARFNSPHLLRATTPSVRQFK
jgi:hypothetical protein